jgi:hypothetical protein
MERRANAIEEVNQDDAGLSKVNTTTARAEKMPGWLSIVLIAARFGLASGLLEIVLLPLEWSYDPRTRLGYRLANRYYLWMEPLGEVAVFGVCGMALGLLARMWPKAGLRIAAYSLCGLAALKLWLLVPELHKLTYVLLACGAAALLGPYVDARIGRSRPRALRSVPILIGVIAALACISHGRELVSEYRARMRLPAAAPGAPNVLLVVMDTVRVDALSLYGYGRETSPNLIRLARRGGRFDWAGAPAPWTLASHASMFTGRWPHELGVSWFGPLDGRYPTLAEVLGARGYRTAGFVANPVFCHADYGLGPGFQNYEDVPVSVLEVLRSPSSACAW